MNKKNFESKMKIFFDKAGVNLLKKGEEYVGGEETVSYLLIDPKRKSFYLAETDILDKNDTELNAIAAYFTNLYGISEVPAKAILRLGRAGFFFSEDFTVKNFNLAPMIRKSAFIISETNAETMSEFLKSRSISFQAVPFKGEFLVMFFDRNNSKKIAELYHKVSDTFLQTSSEALVSDDQVSEDFQLVDEIDKTIRENQILFDIDKYDTLTIKDKKEEDSNVEDEPLFDDPVSVSSEEFHAKSGMGIDEELSENEKNALNIAAGGYQTKDFKTSAKNLSGESKSQRQFSRSISKDKAENFQASMKPAAPRPSEAVSGSGRLNSEEPLFFGIIKNIGGFIFFLPAYVLYKISYKKAPAFIIYWAAAVLIFFGLYHLIISPFGNIFYEGAISSAKHAATYASGLLNVTKDAVAAEEASGNIMNSALVYFIGEISAWDWFRKGLILKYFLSFSVGLMIFPFMRKLGARLSVFSILLYFLLPLMLLIQTYILKGAVEGYFGPVRLALAAGDRTVIFSAVSSSIAFAAYVLPLIFMVVIYLISGFISSYIRENNKSEVIP